MTRKETGFYNCKDIQELFECKATKAYDLIRSLNKERKENNLIVVAGKIPADYFNKRFFE